MIDVKICGVRTIAVTLAALEGGATYIGLMCYRQSPRYVDLNQASLLRRTIGKRAKVIAVGVDMSNDELDAVVEKLNPDGIQAHGAESTKRITEIKQRYGLLTIKAISIGSPADIRQAHVYTAADMILFDSRTSQRGGSGIPFEWRWLKNLNLPKPQKSWLLAGGLNKDNLAQAVAESGAACVDVSSGVEIRPGEKSTEQVNALMAVANKL